MQKKRIFWQLFPSYLIVIIASMLAIAWYASRSVRIFYEQHMTTELAARAMLAGSQLREFLSASDLEGIDQTCDALGAASGTRITYRLKG